MDEIIKLAKEDQRTIVVMDYTGLLNCPSHLKAPGFVHCIPLSTVRMLDILKDSDDPEQRKGARRASNLIEKLGIKVAKQKLSVALYEHADQNATIGVAALLKKENPKKKVMVFTAWDIGEEAEKEYGIEWSGYLSDQQKQEFRRKGRVMSPLMKSIMPIGPAIVAASAILSPAEMGFWSMIGIGVMIVILFAVFFSHFESSATGGVGMDEPSWPRETMARELDPAEPINWILYGK